MDRSTPPGPETGSAAAADPFAEIPPDAGAATDLSDLDDDPPCPTETWAWLHTLLALPAIGGFLGFCLAALPAFAVLLLAAEMSATTVWSDTFEMMLLLIALPPTWLWLGFLERKAGLALCLPIPLVSIRLKWLVPPLGAVVLLILLGVFG